MVASQSRANGHRWLADYANVTKWVPLDADANGWDITLTNDTTAVGGAARIAYTTDPTVSKERVRATRTTRLDSLRGEYDVWLRCSPTAISKHWPKLGWSPSTVDPVAEFLDEVPVEVPAGVTTFGYIDVKLGRIAIPEDTRHVIGGLGFELHSRRESGTGNLDADFLFFVPVDEFNSTIYVPGANRTSWGAAQLLTPVTEPAGGTAGVLNADGTLDLNNAGDNVGTPPQAGLAFPVGRHTSYFWIQPHPGAGTNTHTIRIRNTTDDNYAATKTYTTGLGFWIRRLEWESVAGKLYQPQIVFDSFTGQTFALRVYFIEDAFAPYITANEYAHAEPEDEVVHKLDSNLDLISYLKDRGGVPLWLKPGPFAISTFASDVRVTDGFPGLDSISTRDPVWSYEYAPRHNQP